MKSVLLIGSILLTVSTAAIFSETALLHGYRTINHGTLILKFFATDNRKLDESPFW
ncbi:MAG: hypothetical protein DSM106950_01760 [Stigonema ocellatum SAG 48.90 = DSM 106950]|nr:hypothetical protein [Stigonema ocellatum SAG 48.90 = DSM 106950]